MSWCTSRSLGVLAVVALFAAAAHAAEWHYFFTNAVTQPYGLSIDANAFDPTKGEGRDVTDGHYAVDAFPGLGIGPYVTPTINWAAGEFAYLWFRFVDVPDDYRIRGWSVSLDHTPASVAYYVVDDTQGGHAAKRWDGAPGLNGANFKKNPQILAAVTANGVQNRATPIQNWNLYDHTTRTALLGAVRYDSNGLRSLQYAHLVGQGFVPPGPIPFDPVPVFGQAHWIPEPAGMALLALAGLLIRRR